MISVCLGPRLVDYWDLPLVQSLLAAVSASAGFLHLHPHHSHTSLLLSFHRSSRELIFVSAKRRRCRSRLLRRVPACSGEGHLLRGDGSIRAEKRFLLHIKSVIKRVVVPLWASRSTWSCGRAKRLRAAASALSRCRDAGFSPGSC